MTDPPRDAQHSTLDYAGPRSSEADREAATRRGDRVGFGCVIFMLAGYSGAFGLTAVWLGGTAFGFRIIPAALSLFGLATIVYVSIGFARGER